ncbi:MAG: ATP-binding cassette domain-containing protein [Planctomycetaceae bacterium]|nr:ATP-binding cassette domain-containing protein [Planctomycetaceae bacterium]
MARGGQVVLALEGLTKRFGDREAVAPLDLEVRSGEVFGLLGSNGAGKTTTLRMVCGLLEPSAGRALVAGHDVAKDPLAAKRAIGHVPDGAPLYAQLSPRQHLQLVGRLFGLGEGAIAADAARLLGGFDLLERADDPVGTFSRGMRQKTAIACALLPRPKLLVLDEPLTGLDATSTALLKEVLRTWADRGGAVLYTSHLLDVVERVCDRMAVLDKGKLVAEGALDDLRQRAGREGTLEQVFAALTQADDPRAAATRLLGPADSDL